MFSSHYALAIALNIDKVPTNGRLDGEGIDKYEAGQPCIVYMDSMYDIKECDALDHIEWSKIRYYIHYNIPVISH